MNPNNPIIEETIGSLEGIRRAAAEPDLFDGVKARLAHPVRRSTYARRPLYWSAAAGLALLIALNIFSAIRIHSDQSNGQATSSGTETEYFSYLEPLNL